MAGMYNANISSDDFGISVIMIKSSEHLFMHKCNDGRVKDESSFCKTVKNKGKCTIRFTFFFRLFQTIDRPYNKIQKPLFVHARHDTVHGNWQGM